MKRIVTIDPSRTQPLVAEIVFVVLTGLVVASLIVNTSTSLTVGVILVMILGVVILQRPDLGLLFVLLARAATDATLPAVQRFVGTHSAAIETLLNPNTGLILTLILGGGLLILSRSLPFLSLPGGRLLTLLLLVGLVGMLRSENILLSFDKWLPVLGTLVVYALAAYLFPRPSDVQRVVDILAGSFILPAAFGFYQLVTGRAFVIPEIGILRIYGTFVHPNAFGLYLVFILSVFVCQAVVQSGPRKVVALLVAASSATLLVATFARASWVGAIIVLITIGILRNRILLFVIPIAVTIALALFPAIDLRLADPLGGSFAHRVDLWQSTLRGWMSLTGAAGASFEVGLNRLTGLGPGTLEPLTFRLQGTGFAAHNDYLHVLVEYGLIGVVLYLALAIVLAIFSYRTWRYTSDDILKATALSFVALTFAYPVMGITDNIFAGTQNQLYFWTLAGLTVAVARIHGLRDIHGTAIANRATHNQAWGQK